VSDPDDTLRLRPAAAARLAASRAPRVGASLVLMLSAGALLLGAAGVGTWWVWLRPAPAVVAVPAPASGSVPAPALSAVPAPALGTGAVPAPPAGAPPLALLPTALPAPPALAAATPRRSVREVLAFQAEEPTLVRLDANPRVFIADFPDLASQAAALNRIAALIEKAHAPRDRVLTEPQLAERIAATGQPAEQYYFGHNYRGEDLSRFFSLLTRQGLPRRPEEARIEAWLAEMRRQEPEGEVALITIPRARGGVDAAAREAILRHEIAHGFYFVDPLFAGYVRRTWNERFPATVREAFRRFLAAEGYDATNEDLVINEAMAYVLFTPDPRFFNPAMVGLDDAAVEALRVLLRPGVPDALQPLMIPPPAVLPAAAR
jgi:hypothetical protein